MSGAGTDAVRYRPRTEAGYARITHLTGDGGDYWEVWSTDGLRSRYGTPAPQNPPPNWADPAVIADPNQPDRIFAWLLTETADPLGNRISYTYQPDPAGTAQRYLSQISYADYGDPASPQYLVTVKIVPDPSPRPDPFSDHRPGFELRTTQRAAAIETWTQAGIPVLARRVELSYADQTGTPPANCRVAADPGHRHRGRRGQHPGPAAAGARLHRLGSGRPPLPAAHRARRPAPGHLAGRARPGPGRHVRRRAALDPAAQRHRPVLAQPRRRQLRPAHAASASPPPG